jgi:hypothetical protein
VDILKFEPARSDKLAKSACCASAKLGFGLASCVVNFRRIEANEPDVGLLAVNLDRVAVDNPDIGRVDPFCVDWYGNEQQCEERCVNFHSRQP